jgi:hypothetical protein
VELIIGGHRAKDKNVNNYKESQRCIIYFYEIMSKKLFLIFKALFFLMVEFRCAIASCYLIVLIRLGLGLSLIVSV